MVSLISKWQLKDGCPDSLQKVLIDLAYKVESSEKGTLMYSVHLKTTEPSSTTESSSTTTGQCEHSPAQTEVTFFEIYKDAEAFNTHLNGPVFTKFRKDTLQYFKEDPKNAGWPKTETEFLKIESQFIRTGLKG
ncbi:MAG: antibiotic biosynthesis monooxygenase [Lentisphaeraceae bacterium]|nr:antibiotic biosynthesis monooxygenase [Lentisphaeraceae bacterium]